MRKAKMVIGAILGGFIPVATYTLSHLEQQGLLSGLLTGAGLLYSAPTVYEWAKKSFGEWYKALGFCLLLEGVMVASGPLGIPILGYSALAILAGLNALTASQKLAPRPASKAPKPRAKRTK